MTRPPARTPDPADTTVEWTTVSFLHDIGLSYLVVGRIIITTIIIFRILNRFIDACYNQSWLNKLLAFVITCIGNILFCILKIIKNIFDILVSPVLAISALIYKSPSSTRLQDIQKKDEGDKDREESREWYEQRRRRPSTPESWRFAYSHNVRDLDDDAYRNWSNEHGNLSPEPATSPETGTGKLQRWVGRIKDLDDDDGKRNWSNEHGNLSPDSVGSSTPSIGSLRRRPPLIRVLVSGNNHVYVHGDSSPQLSRLPGPGTRSPYRQLPSTKDLDDDHNRNWSNGHGNLSPESLSPTTPRSGNDDLVFDDESSSSSTIIFAPSTFDPGSSDPSKVQITPTTTNPNSDDSVV